MIKTSFNINYYLLMLLFFVLGSCTSQKELAYLNNLPIEETSFPVEPPNYIINSRDILYVTVKAMTVDGLISDLLISSRTSNSQYVASSEAGNYLYGYDVNESGYILLPVIGPVKVSGYTIEEARDAIQEAADKVFNNTTVDCKLLSFKFTVIGEVRTPGTFVNYNNYLTVLEAIGRAGGISDYGKRDKVLVVRPYEGGTKTYTVSSQDKELLSSQAYFLLPNDLLL